MRNKKMGVKFIFFVITVLYLATLCSCAAQCKASAPAATSGELKAYYLDVGQSDCTVITAGGETIIVDAGDHEHAGDVLKFLKNQGIEEIKYLVLTHSDTDHIGGAQALMYNLPIEKIIIADQDSIPADQLTYSAEKLYLAIQKVGIETLEPAQGAKLTVGDATVEILGPLNDYEDKNENSICLKVTHGENGFLFTGDAGIKPEDDMIDAGEDLSCKVLQAGHHGASESNGYRLLREAYPEYVVISCGYDNQYGHPHEACLSRIHDQGAEVFRTDQQGTITATSDGKTVTMTAETASVSDADGTNSSAADSAAAGQNAGGSKSAGLAKDSDKAGSNSGSNSAGQIAGGSNSGGSNFGSNSAGQNAGGSKSGGSNSDSSGATASDSAYIGNVKTKKFHYPSCGGLPAEKSRIYFDSAQEAKDAGYDPCGNCHPK